MSTAKWHVRRSVLKGIVLPADRRRGFEQSLLRDLDDAYTQREAYSTRWNQVSVEDFECVKHLAHPLAVGEVDKEKTSGFLA